MENNDININDELQDEAVSNDMPANHFDAAAVHNLSGMYQTWFLDYASYVILERAVPHLADGLKPVQRRILHTMKIKDDGRFNKVANIVGSTMQFHPHGDASIYSALVNLGQKDLLIDCQGNWGNVLTGDSAAAPRYIEARLSAFAKEVVFNPKTTEWQMSYDGREKEPITLPPKFPLLLAQGADGIAVGLASKVLPHNFTELCDAAIHYLHGEEFQLYPDFPTGGAVDVKRYNEGGRGGAVKIRAKIEKVDTKTLVIREVPYGKTTGTLIDSIVKAIDKGKVKARKVDDKTAAKAEIIIHLTPGVSPDKTIDALYAFTDCEVSVSPNCCVIDNGKPQFMTVSEVLRRSTDKTLALLQKELEIRRQELQEQLLFVSLEKIFIEERIYKDRKFETASNMDAAVEHIDSRLSPFYPSLSRVVTRNDILRLMEIKMGRILKFNKDKADELMAKIEAEIADIDSDLSDMVAVTVRWFQHLKDKYGAAHPRLTEIKNFDTIEAVKVAEANQKLYINRAEGFIGTGLKKDEFVCNCSDIDEVIVFFRDGKYKVVKVAEKLYIGKDIYTVDLYKRNDVRTVYNAVYRDGMESKDLYKDAKDNLMLSGDDIKMTKAMAAATGKYYVKRFCVTSAMRDREYDLTQGKPGSRLAYLSINHNGEAEVLKMTLDSKRSRLTNIIRDCDFSAIDIKGRTAHGTLFTNMIVQRISVKRLGHSTLGGRQVWFDPVVKRLNYERHGNLLGEFNDNDRILIVLDSGEFYTTNFDVNNHYEDNIKLIEKHDPQKAWTVVVRDADMDNQVYMKRCLLEAITRKQTYIGDNPKNRLLCLTDEPKPQFQVTFGGDDSFHTPMDIDAEEFTPIRSFKTRGKRISTLTISDVTLIKPQPTEEADEKADTEQGETTEGNATASDTATGDTNAGNAVAGDTNASNAAADNTATSNTATSNDSPSDSKADKTDRTDKAEQLNLFDDDKE